MLWQSLKPFEKFAALIERPWNSMPAYYRPEGRVGLVFVEGLKKEIHVIQQCRCGRYDGDHLHAKSPTCTLRPLSRTMLASSSPTRMPEEPTRHGRANNSR